MSKPAVPRPLPSEDEGGATTGWEGDDELASDLDVPLIDLGVQQPQQQAAQEAGKHGVPSLVIPSAFAADGAAGPLGSPDPEVQAEATPGLAGPSNSLTEVDLSGGPGAPASLEHAVGHLNSLSASVEHYPDTAAPPPAGGVADAHSEPVSPAACADAATAAEEALPADRPPPLHIEAGGEAPPGKGQEPVGDHHLQEPAAIVDRVLPRVASSLDKPDTPPLASPKSPHPALSADGALPNDGLLGDAGAQQQPAEDRGAPNEACHQRTPSDDAESTASTSHRDAPLAAAPDADGDSATPGAKRGAPPDPLS